MDDAPLRRLVHHPLVDQRVDMLDKTKCSTTARNVFNYICGGLQTMKTNNNLASVTPNLASLVSGLSGRGGDRVAYVHFDHLTNDTSHYFIVVVSEGRVMLLQSAVFEFSIRDWLFPDEADAESFEALNSGLAANQGEPAELMAFVREQLERTRAREVAVLDSIRSCRWTAPGGASFDAAEFVAEFVPLLESLEGTWAEGDVAAHAETFRSLFACRLQEDVVRAAIRTGFDKPAAFKVQWAQGRMPEGRLSSPPPLDVAEQ